MRVGDSRFDHRGAEGAERIEPLAGRLAADLAHGIRSGSRAESGRRFIESLYRIGKFRIWQPRKIGILRPVLSVCQGLFGRPGQPLVAEVVGAGRAGGLPDDCFDRDGGVRFGHVLVDNVVGETRQRRLDGGKYDLGFGGF